MVVAAAMLASRYDRLLRSGLNDRYVHVVDDGIVFNCNDGGAGKIPLERGEEKESRSFHVLLVV